MRTTLIRDLLRYIAKRRYEPRSMAIYLRKCGAEVGDECFISPCDLDTQIDPHLLKIGRHVAIADGVSFMTPPNAAGFRGRNLPPAGAIGPVIICDNCFIGSHAVLYPNIRIGPNSVVAAASVVTSDVPPNALVLGSPARPFGSIDRYREKCIQRWAAQRPPEVVIEPGETWWSTPHLIYNRELLRQRLLVLFHDELSS